MITNRLPTQPYKGTRDFFPHEMKLHNWIFKTLSEMAQKFGYQQYNGPMLENFELYAAKTGEEIVESQLYWFLDRKKRKVAIRPEMTPTMARMVAQQLYHLPLPIRWFSTPNLWRYERPQRGRLREHWQFNIDLLGGDENFSDQEMLEIAHHTLHMFGKNSRFKIHVNHKGFTDFFFEHKLGISSEKIPHLSRFLDRRKKLSEKEYIQGLEELGLGSQKQEELNQFFEFSFEDLKKFDNQPAEHLVNLKTNLKDISPSLHLDTSVFRGMDYYTGLVFEAYDESPENPRALFGGGRYDHLIELFSSKKLSGIGFGLGDVTLENFLQTHNLLPPTSYDIDVWITFTNESHFSLMQNIAQELRTSGFQVGMSLSPGSFSEQLKMADKHKSHWALLLGEKELEENKVVIKNLKTSKQSTINLKKIPQELKSQKEIKK